jgi:hypothetical protein
MVAFFDVRKLISDIKGRTKNISNNTAILMTPSSGKDDVLERAETCCKC